jgi:hypothetical protein
MERKSKSAKTIKVSVYFHTSEGEGRFEPRVAFKKGWVEMPTNHKHGIRAGRVKPIYFSKTQYSLSEAIAECLKQNGVKIIAPEEEAEYLKFQRVKANEGFYEKDLKL